jgi:hypothetical protein
MNETFGRISTNEITHHEIMLFNFKKNEDKLEIVSQRIRECNLMPNEEQLKQDAVVINNE